MLGDFAPGLVGYTDNVLFGDVWKRPDLAARDRSLVTVTCLVISGNTDQLVYHLGLAKDNWAHRRAQCRNGAAHGAGWLPRPVIVPVVTTTVAGSLLALWP